MDINSEGGVQRTVKKQQQKIHETNETISVDLCPIPNCFFFRMHLCSLEQS